MGQRMIVLVIPAWLALALVSLLIFPPAALIPAVGLILSLVWFFQRYEAIQLKRREKAIEKAVRRLDSNERLDSQNRAGRYVAPGAIPRTLPKKFMTDAEQFRWANKLGEFSES